MDTFVLTCCWRHYICRIKRKSEGDKMSFSMQENVDFGKAEEEGCVTVKYNRK